MASIQGQVAPTYTADGALQTVRISRDGALTSQDAHAQYQEAALRGNLWSLANATAGVTVTGLNTIAQITGSQPVLAISNPAGSGKALVVSFIEHMWSSGTAAAGGLALGVLTGANVTAITAASTNTAVNTYTGNVGGSVAKTYAGATALAGQLTAATLVRYAGGPTTGALSANQQCYFQLATIGAVCVYPGNLLGLWASGAGTSPIVNASWVWEEVAL